MLYYKYDSELYLRSLITGPISMACIPDYKSNYVLFTRKNRDTNDISQNRLSLFKSSIFHAGSQS